MKFLQRSLAMILVIAMCSGMMLTTAFAAGSGSTCLKCNSSAHVTVSSTKDECTWVTTTYYCTECGTYWGETVSGPGHVFEDGACTKCGAADPDAKPVDPEEPEGPSEPEVEKCGECGMELRFGKCTNPECVVNMPTDPEETDPAEPEQSAEPEQTECTHTWGTEWVADSDGHYHVCENCGKIQATSKKPHVSGEAVRENVTADSYDEVVYCTICGTELSRKTVSIDTDPEGPADPEDAKCTETRHVKLVLVAGTYATCTETGVKEHYECMTCGKLFLGTKECTDEDLIVPATSHHYEDGECSDCGAAEPVCKHSDPTHHEAVPATCTEDGMKAYWVCNDCGKMFVGTSSTEVTADDLIDPATGHSYTDRYESQGTWHAQVCDVCGEVGEHVAHTGVWVVVEEATSEAEGLKVCRCEDCGYVLKEEVIPATGSGSDTEGPVDPEEPEQPAPIDPDLAATPDHVYVTGEAHRVGSETIVKEPTCSEVGYKVFYCFTCGGYYKEVIPTTSHTWGTEWTAAADGQGHYHTCEVCGASQATSMAPHTPGEAVRQIEDGIAYDVVYCTDCGAEISRSTIIDDPDIPTGSEPSRPSDRPGSGSSDEDLADDGLVTIDDVDVPMAGLMTRAEFVNYLYVRKGSPSAPWPSFADVPADHPYAMAIGWAQINGIAWGVSETEFYPDALVTVEQARLFLMRYASLEGRAMPELAALPHKDPDEVLVEADAALDEFFGGEDL